MEENENEKMKKRELLTPIRNCGGHDTGCDVTRVGARYAEKAVGGLTALHEHGKSRKHTREFQHE